MTPIQGAVMGVVQGLTEFLPVSSSGHLAAARHFLHAGLAQDLGFEVAVHMGTLLAVLIFFHRKIIEIFTGAFQGRKDGWCWIMYIIVGTIPAGVVGLMYKDSIENLFNNLHLVGLAWIFTAAMLFLCERFARPSISAARMGWLRALIIGVCQAVAIIPGVSRSGSTISAGMAVGVNKDEVVDFSFILSLPAVGGATLLTVKDWVEGSAAFGMAHVLGGLTAGVSGYIAIAVMLRAVAKGRMVWFAWYCAVIGVLTVLLV